MKRWCEGAALVAIATTVAFLLGGLANAEPRMRGAIALDLDWIANEMHGNGFLRRADVVIEIDAGEVAAGYSRPGCDGLLLVAPLPRTAQGWGHIAPRLDLSRFAVRYAYDGNLYASVPRLQRLGHRLIAELRPGSISSQPRLVALAEAGKCGLIIGTEASLIEFSRRNTYLALAAHRGRVDS